MPNTTFENEDDFIRAYQGVAIDYKDLENLRIAQARFNEIQETASRSGIDYYSDRFGFSKTKATIDSYFDKRKTGDYEGRSVH